MNFRKKLFISWVGLRGAAPIVFATYPLLAQIYRAGDQRVVGIVRGAGMCEHGSMQGQQKK
jgi:NhaP-type Na+/H+ or K+/H+ antiporter